MGQKAIRMCRVDSALAGGAETVATAIAHQINQWPKALASRAHETSEYKVRIIVRKVSR